MEDSLENRRFFLAYATIAIASLVIVANACVVFVLNPLQEMLLPGLSQLTSLVFLPHGIKILATVVLRFKAVPGLVLGALVAAPAIWGLTDYKLIVLLSLTAGLTAWVVFEALNAVGMRVFYGLKDEGQPALRNLLAAGLICSALNGVLMTVFLDSFGYVSYVATAIIAIVIGDSMGLVMTWLLAKFGLDLLRKTIR